MAALQFFSALQIVLNVQAANRVIVDLQAEDRTANFLTEESVPVSVVVSLLYQ